MAPLSAERIQLIFPHICKELVGLCAICKWVRERWSTAGSASLEEHHAAACAVGKQDRA